jgi:hypothetical protein
MDCKQPDATIAPMIFCQVYLPHWMYDNPLAWGILPSDVEFMA